MERQCGAIDYNSKIECVLFTNDTATHRLLLVFSPRLSCKSILAIIGNVAVRGAL